ncbi:MAG: winged helix-turn-helix transcriptional regulator, partial [Nitrososphaera sp.]
IVLQFINEHPGCHLRQVRNEVGISMGTAQYHLARLEKAGRITSNRRGLFKYYFPIGLFQDNEKNLLEVLSQETAREILMFIIEQKTPTQTDIVGRIGVSPASISWHVSRLNEFGIITEVKEGKYKRYQLRGDPKSLISLMKSYYPSLWDRWSSRLAEMFLSLSPAEGKES